MTTINRAAAIATVACEAAPIIASAIADLPHPASLRFTYQTRGVEVTATSAQRLTEAEPALAAAFAASAWGFTACAGPGDFSDRDRLSFQAPDALFVQDEPTCLYCNGPGPLPFRSCCSVRCSYLEHDWEG